MHWLILCVSLMASVFGALGARILVVLPFISSSHIIYQTAVLHTLADRGHQLVVYSGFRPHSLRPNYTYVPIEVIFNEGRKWTYENFKQHRVVHEDQLVPQVGSTEVWQLLYPFCEQTFKDKNIQKLLNSNEHFDLVLTESSFGQESMLVFGHKFKAPTITLQAFVLWSGVNRAAGNALSIASIPDYTSSVMTDQMTFKERVYNFLSTMMTMYQFYNIHLPIHQELINKYYPGEAPSLMELVTNVSLYFVNSHPAVEYSQPYTPNIVPVAGISLTGERTTLPQDIQKFMDDANAGVIFLSFGNVVPIELFPKEILQIFVNVFKKINCKVIWKTGLKDFPGLPKNVMLRNWLPQPGILAHPNLLLFITHGGLNSQLEAIQAGVPTVGIPFFGDQPYNVRFNEHREIGTKVDFNTLSEDSLLSALTKIMTDTKYKENAQKMSRIFRDRPVSPADSVVFWTEYVLRHAGASHLQPAAARLALYQLWLLDVAAVVSVVLLLLLATVFIVISKVLSSVLNMRNVSSSKKNN